MTQSVVDAALDLLLGGACVGCGRAGRVLCGECAAGLPCRAAPAWPSPTPDGLVEPWAAAVYEGTVRAMVLGLKERALYSLAGPVARMLASAVASGLAPTDAPFVLVPVPSRPATVRARGHDPTHTITARAARLLRREGYDVSAQRLLWLGRRVADQAGLDAAERAANLAGSMRARVSRGPVRAVVCDDVLTTGSTAREAQRALADAGVEVVRIAVVAATRRRNLRVRLS